MFRDLRIGDKVSTAGQVLTPHRKVPHMNTSESSPIALPLGRIFATPGALSALEESGQAPAEFLCRHARGDWGCVSPEDGRLNDRAVDSGARVLSAYETHLGVRLWVITEAEDDQHERTHTTILLPQEY